MIHGSSLCSMNAFFGFSYKYWDYVLGSWVDFSTCFPPVIPKLQVHLVLTFCLFVLPPAAAAVAKSTLCNPLDGRPPGSPVPGILQARTLEWVAISFSNAWKWEVKVKSLSCVWLLATPCLLGYWNKSNILLLHNMGSCFSSFLLQFLYSFLSLTT